MSRWKGSMITAARLSWCAAMMASVSARSLKGAISTSSPMACGMPAESGVGAVETALELQDLVALAEGPRHAQREERRLAARGGIAHLLGAGHGAADLLGQGHGGLGELEVRRAPAELRFDG